MLDEIAFMMKTYRDDFAYFEDFIQSFDRHNKEGIKLYIICPLDDVKLFDVEYKNVEVVPEEELPVEYFNRMIGTFKPGYLNQEIVKLSFWKLGVCKNYFCVDSECVFIRDFYINDFMWDESVPYTVFYDDSEMISDASYYRDFGEKRKMWNKVIAESLGLDGKKLCSCHGMGIISGEVMRTFEHDYMKPNSLVYKDLIERAPLEFTWYNYWIQKSGCIVLHPIPPLVKSYHTEFQLNLDRCADIGVDDLKRSYIGMLINSYFGKAEEIPCHKKIWKNDIKYKLIGKALGRI